MSHLRTLYAVLKHAQRRAAWHEFFREYSAWLVWVFAGFAVVAAVSPTLYWGVLAAGFLTLCGMAVAFLRVRRRAKSDYQTALEIDRAAGLKDRLSTAVYFSSDSSNSPILERQRADAAAHAARLDVPALVPLGVRHAARIPLALLVLCAALFSYRMYSEAPVLALLKRSIHSELVKAMVQPIVRMMERQPTDEPANGPDQQARNDEDHAGEPRDAIAPPAAAAESQKARAAPASGRDDASAARREKEKQDQASGQAEDREEQQEERQPSGSAQQGEGRQQAGGQRPQQARSESGGQNGRREPQQAGSRQQQQDGSGRGNQSLAQSVVQALKNLFSKPNPGQSAPAQGQMAQNSQPQEQQAPGQNSGQSPNSASRAGQSGQDASSQAPQPQDGNQQNQSRKPGTGVGTQPGTQQNDASGFLNVSGRREVVDPPVQKFEGEALVHARNGDGQMSAPAGAAATPGMAASSGAEQESVPLRYRVYVQRYFDRATRARKTKE